MCLAIPARITAVDARTETATVMLGGVGKSISLALVDDVGIGDYVLVHVGYALNKISEEEANLTLEAIAEMARLDDSQGLASEPSARHPSSDLSTQG